MDPADVSLSSWSSSVDNQKEEYKIWDYNPSIAAAAVGAGVCGFLTLLHALRLARNRVGFCIPFIIGGLVSPLLL